MTEAAPPNQRVLDEIKLIRIVDEVDNTVDEKDWTTCQSYFLDDIHADFTSLAGGSPGPMKADDLVGAWETNLYGEKKTHHMRSNHKVAIDGDEAEVFSKGYALNILASSTGSDLWEVWGKYVHTLRRTENGWKVSGMSLFVKHARGNERARDFVPDSGS